MLGRSTPEYRHNFLSTTTTELKYDEIGQKIIPSFICNGVDNFSAIASCDFPICLSVNGGKYIF